MIKHMIATVAPIAENPIVAQAFEIINRELEHHPTYWEGKKVLF